MTTLSPERSRDLQEMWKEYGTGVLGVSQTLGLELFSREYDVHSFLRKAIDWES